MYGRVDRLEFRNFESGSDCGVEMLLTTPWAGYLPTEKAVAGGGYSAVIESGLIGPEGGQILVDRTVDMVNAMFAEGKP